MSSGEFKPATFYPSVTAPLLQSSKIKSLVQICRTQLSYIPTTILLLILFWTALLSFSL